MTTRLRKIKIFDAVLNSIPSITFDRSRGGKINYFLLFTISKDEAAYKATLDKMIHFPTFWPIIVLYILIAILHDNFISKFNPDNIFFSLDFYISIVNFFFMLLYTMAIGINHHKKKLWACTTHVSNLILKRFFFGHIEDVILLLVVISQGFHLITIINKYNCSKCDNYFSMVCCDLNTSNSINTNNDDTVTFNKTNKLVEFPIIHIFFGYISLYILPNYFKSMNRHVVLCSWLILTIFVIVAYVVHEYKLKPFVVLFVVFFLCAIYENERDKMAIYLQGKQEINREREHAQILQERNKKDIARKLNVALVHQILPPKVADQILAGKHVAPEMFEEVTIFFSDVEGFTTICAQVSPAEVVNMLNDLYTVMDYCTSKFPLYKVETIGDAYMLVGGLPTRDKDHALQIADFALHVQQAVQSVKSPIDGSPIRIRIGIHSGPAMAGVVGNLMPRYCLFGDTVNTASRMESNGLAGKIHCSEKNAQILMKKGKHIVTERGAMEIKGKGVMTTYWLEGAMPHNEESNELAIHKMEIMVQEILSDVHAETEKDMYGFFAQPLSPTTSAPAMNIGNSNNNGSANGGNSVRSHQSHYSHHSHNSEHGSNNGDSNVNINLFNTPEKGRKDSNGQLMLQTRSSLGSNNSGQNSPEGREGGREHHKHARHSIKYALQHGLLTTNEYDCIEDISNGAKILVVEDSASQRKMLIKKLKQADPSWDISSAVNGEDALSMLKAARLQFDVVFVDENLSLTDGLFGHELVEVMRKQFKMHHCVIIACTGNPVKVGQDLMNSGVDHVWPKPPPDAKVIKLKIEELLNEKLKMKVINLED